MLLTSFDYNAGGITQDVHLKSRNFKLPAYRYFSIDTYSSTGILDKRMSTKLRNLDTCKENG